MKIQRQRVTIEPRLSVSGRPRCRTRRLAGFSLIEVMCALLILGVGLLGMIQGLATALASNKEAELQTTAALIAAGRIELLQADGFLIEGEESGDCEEIPLYRWRQSITQTSLEGLFDIQITIENANTSRIVCDLRTLLFDPPAPPPKNSTSPDAAGSKKSDRRREGGRW